MDMTKEKLYRRYTETRDEVAYLARDLVYEIGHEIYCYNHNIANPPGVSSKLRYYMERVTELKTLYSLLSLEEKAKIPPPINFIDVKVDIQEDAEYA